MIARLACQYAGSRQRGLHGLSWHMFGHPYAIFMNAFTAAGGSNTDSRAKSHSGFTAIGAQCDSGDNFEPRFRLMFQCALQSTVQYAVNVALA